MFSAAVKFGLGVLTFTNLVTAGTRKAGSTVAVNDVYYYVPSVPVSSLGVGRYQLRAAASPGEDLIPLTVMKSNCSKFDASVLKEEVERYSTMDDVFNPGFMQAIYLASVASTYPNTALASSLTDFGNKLFMTSSSSSSAIPATNCSQSLPIGPYFLHAYTGDVYQAWRLYSDYEGAFTEGIIAHAAGHFSTLSASIAGVQSPTIGVPSRLYYTKTKSKPLAGVRLGIKDIYDIAGTKRGCGNRAYYDLYPERNTTAPAVQKLIDAGAIIVGKMKTSQFANGETATADWVDYHSPFNARGDGYSDPSSSSSGPGAGIGAYEWLDLALGSDTGGSVRNPAQVNGAYGNRPTHGLVMLDNVMPLSPLMDTAGFLTRDATIWKTAGEVLYSGNLTDFSSFPKTIYTSGFPSNASNEAEGVLLDFLAKLESFLNTTQPPSVLDYESMWTSSQQAVFEKTSTLTEFLLYTYGTLISKQQYEMFGAPFISDYQAAFNGRTPFLDPSPLVRWNWARFNLTDEDLESGIHNKTVFTEWWNKEVLRNVPGSCSDSLLLYPGALATPNYRNVYRDPPGLPLWWGVSSIGPIAGVPDVVFPLGQASYNSTITMHEEVLPVAVNIIAAPGCDAMLFELAEQLQKVGIINAPKAGSRMYSS
ncbi:amidase signature domain-containing protein [Cadophora sp. MPI-SDFR-AT-0126]|nr:amidase signature domain-containing protein [Leotiomycetes sp. MPI-SDFR-AT-0126]